MSMKKGPFFITHERMLNITVIREIQVKSTTKYHFMPSGMAMTRHIDNTHIGKDEEKQGPAHTAGRKIK